MATMNSVQFVVKKPASGGQAQQINIAKPQGVLYC
jgi:hypothetical protein